MVLSFESCGSGDGPCFVLFAEVHMYGLMAEHSNDDIVVWNGEHGDFATNREWHGHLKRDYTHHDMMGTNMRYPTMSSLRGVCMYFCYGQRR